MYSTIEGGYVPRQPFRNHDTDHIQAAGRRIYSSWTIRAGELMTSYTETLRRSGSPSPAVVACLAGIRPSPRPCLCRTPFFFHCEEVVVVASKAY